MGALPVANKLALGSPFLPRPRRPCGPTVHGRRPRHGAAVVAYMEPNPNSPAAIAGRVIGALPVVGLVARILSDEGGVGGDIIDFAEFRRRVSKKCTVMDSQAFYDFNERRAKVPTHTSGYSTPFRLYGSATVQLPYSLSENEILTLCHRAARRPFLRFAVLLAGRRWWRTAEDRGDPGRRGAAPHFQRHRVRGGDLHRHDEGGKGGKRHSAVRRIVKL
jgi:hypothetical protein